MIPYTILIKKSKKVKRAKYVKTKLLLSRYYIFIMNDD